MPLHTFIAQVQAVGRARATAAQVVVIERQRRVRRRIAGIGLGTLFGEVARVAGTAVDAGTGLIHIVAIASRALTAHQAGAVSEHVNGTGYILCVPLVTDIYGPQVTAISEHPLHIRHISGVEGAQVKACQASAFLEHEHHVHHAGRVESVQIKIPQTSAILKHA